MRHTLDVLEAIQRDSPLTQHELVAATRLSRGTVSAIMQRLRRQGLIESVSTDADSIDLDSRLPVRIRSTATPAVCVDIGSQHVAVGVGGPGGFSDEPCFEDLAAESPASEALEHAVELTRKVLTDHEPSISPSELVGACVSMAAPIDQARGQIASMFGVSSWTGLRPAEELKYRLGSAWSRVPFMLENNSNLMALAEFERGAAKIASTGKQDAVIFVRWSDGIGGAALIDGELIVGTRGVATEIGHTPIHRDKNQGMPRCVRCGHICVESLASGQALTEAYWEKYRVRLSFRELIMRAVESDGIERKLLQDAAVFIGEVIGGYVSFLNARLVVISGRHFGKAPDNIEAYRVVADAMRAGMQSTALPAALEDVEITLGERSRFVAIEGGIIAALRADLPSFFEERILATV